MSVKLDTTGITKYVQWMTQMEDMRPGVLPVIEVEPAQSDDSVTHLFCPGCNGMKARIVNRVALGYDIPEYVVVMCGLRIPTPRGLPTKQECPLCHQYEEICRAAGKCVRCGRTPHDR